MSSHAEPPATPVDPPGLSAPSERASQPPEDVPRAIRFLNLMDAQSRVRIEELSASFYALVETLVAGGVLRLDQYERRRQLTVVRENERSQEELGVALVDVPDKYALRELPVIDCAERLHLCEARCCRFELALSVQDLDERVLRWDYGRPYRLAKRADGQCIHNEEGRCGAYAARPAVCRSYDCRSDKRVWLDFDKRIPAP